MRTATVTDEAIPAMLTHYLQSNSNAHPRPMYVHKASCTRREGRDAAKPSKRKYTRDFRKSPISTCIKAKSTANILIPQSLANSPERASPHGPGYITMKSDAPESCR